jgi:hypothetical protein
MTFACIQTETAQMDALSGGKGARAMKEARNDAQSIRSNDAKLSDCDVQNGGCVNHGGNAGLQGEIGYLSARGDL